MPLRLFPMVIALCLLTTAVYWPGLSGGFLFDDYPNILTNQRVHAETLNLRTLELAASAYQQGPIGRPLATLSFAVNYAIGGKDPWAFKLTGLIVHLINTVAVFWLLRRLFGLPSSAGIPRQNNATPWNTAAIFTITLLWATHPLQVSSVLYVVQRMETLSLTFVLIALIIYIHGRTEQINGKNGWHWLAGAILAAGAGLLSKETAVLFPAYSLALELSLLRFRAKSHTTQSIIKLTYGAGVVMAAILFVALVLPHYTSPQAYAIRDFTVGERLLTQMRVLPMYLEQMLLPLPANLVFYYDDYQKSTSLLEPITTLAGGVFLLFLLSLAAYARKRAPLLALGILWFFSAHALTSNVVNLELAFEHRNYFALLGVLIALAEIVRHIPTGTRPLVRQATVGVLVIGIGALGMLRSATWGDPLLLAMNLVALNPESARASSDLGEQYMILANGRTESPFYAKAIDEFERGSVLPNSSPLPEQGLILMSALSGEPVLDEWWDRIERKLAARPIGPQESIMVLGLVQQRYKGVPLDDRRLADLYTVLAERASMPPLQFAHLGDHALIYLHDQALANAMFVKAIESSVGNPAYAEQLIGVLRTDGHLEQARAAENRARELGLVPKGSFGGQAGDTGAIIAPAP
ncbi:hypothetical protein [Lysobacter sp. F60174L2]|uniref:hypothetical protein n=1 Tax=Lysobacter sp. F60174L2 TaxID=3459295 RepID=UPI00403E23E4